MLAAIAISLVTLLPTMEKNLSIFVGAKLLVRAAGCSALDAQGNDDGLRSAAQRAESARLAPVSALLYAEAQDWEDAAEQSGQVRAGDRRRSIWLRLGTIADCQGDRQAAINWWRRADARSAFMSAARVAQYRDLALAVDWFERAIVVGQDVDDFCEAANFAAKADSTEDKRAYRDFLLRIANQLGPDSSIGALSQGEAELISGNYEQARRSLEWSLTQNPADHRAHYSLGLALRGLGLHDQEALAQFETAVALRPDNLWYRYILGQTLLIVGENQRAISEMDRALALDDKYWRFWDTLAAAYRATHQPDQEHLACAKAAQWAAQVEDVPAFCGSQ
jgi:tetratricopeptide (TPR) repeat protein